MPLILYPEVKIETSLPVIVSGIGVGCPQLPALKLVSASNQIITTVSGSGSIQIGEKKIDLPAGCGLFIRKNVTHSIAPSAKGTRSQAENGWLVDLLSFDASGELFSDELFTSNEYVFFRFRDPAVVSSSMRRIHASLMSDARYGMYSASAELYSLLIKLNQEALDIPQMTQKASPVINSVVKYIDDNFTEEISLGDLCAAAGGISEQYLCRLFKQYTGERPIEFILHKRIGMARSYLEKTDIPIADIAKMTGFNNTSYFYRNFKKFVGMSPLSCRQNSLGIAAPADARI